MAVNHYFQAGRGIGNENERRLHEDIIIESLKIFGQDIYYMPRTLVNRDLIFGEDTSSKFDDSYALEMYFESNEGFAGEQEIINKFGLEIRDDTTLVVAKRRFEEHVANKNNLIASGRPNEGDVLSSRLQAAQDQCTSWPYRYQSPQMMANIPYWRCVMCLQSARTWLLVRLVWATVLMMVCAHGAKRKCSA